jgi:Tfp pilus assembly protein FimT
MEAKRRNERYIRRTGLPVFVCHELVELILVLVITAALAVFALPKVVDTTLWRLRSFGDDLVARHHGMLRLALQQPGQGQTHPPQPSRHRASPSAKGSSMARHPRRG